MTTKSGKQCSSAQKEISDVSELKQWMIEGASCVCIRDGRFQRLL